MTPTQPKSLTTIADLVAGNAKYAANFKDGDLPLPPFKKYIIVTCMDSRIHPSTAFGVPLGGAHIIRNAGGSAYEALRSIIISQQLLGTEHILLIKHTNCGMASNDNDDVYEKIGIGLGEEAGKKVREEGFDFLSFKEKGLEESVREEVEFLRRSLLVKPPKVGGGVGTEGEEGESVSGWIYEVETGRVRRVI